MNNAAVQGGRCFRPCNNERLRQNENKGLDGTNNILWYFLPVVVNATVMQWL